MQNNAPAVLDLPGAAGRPRCRPAPGAARFDLDIIVGEVLDAEGRPAGLRGSVMVAADLFDAGQRPGASRRGSCGCWRRWPLTRRPGCTQVEVLDEAERRQILAGWNDTAAVVPAAAGCMSWSRRGRRRAPDAVAVVCGGAWLIVWGLAERASRLARYLRRAGVGPESVVGLCLERRPEMIAAILAVWQAGAAYLPLDPGYPADRLAFMVADSGAGGGRCRGIGVGLAGAVVSGWMTRWWRRMAVLPAGTRGRCWSSPVLVLAWRRVRAVAGRWWMSRVAARRASGLRRTADRAGRLLLGHLAYVIYTSGSTGRPKGVVVSHAGLASLAAAQAAGSGWGRGRGCCSSRRRGLTRRCGSW